MPSSVFADVSVVTSCEIEPRIPYCGISWNIVFFSASFMKPIRLPESEP